MITGDSGLRTLIRTSVGAVNSADFSVSFDFIWSRLSHGGDHHNRGIRLCSVGTLSRRRPAHVAHQTNDDDAFVREPLCVVVFRDVCLSSHVTQHRDAKIFGTESEPTRQGLRQGADP